MAEVETSAREPPREAGSGSSSSAPGSKDPILAHGKLARGRFVLLSMLGQGAHGVVYAARDEHTGAIVAVKVLRNVTPEGIERFKQEFRALLDVHHENLVELGELFEDEGTWFFSMELIEGVDFLEYVSSGSNDADVEPEHVPFHEARLRNAMQQLATALHTLHQRGHVHRDVKPSNLRVTQGGRLVLLDLGLVTAIAEDADAVTQRAVGTVAYMAPEQARGVAVGPEADFYAAGVVLYEALTGQLPFTGPQLKVLADKQKVAPIAPRTLVPSIPEDLDALCQTLLLTDPMARPAGITVLSLLRGAGARTAISVATSRVEGDPFVGRAREISALDDALRQATHAATRVVIQGESGVGKSRLLHEWLTRTHPLSPTWKVLHGRCHEQEQVPYQALEGILDALTRELVHLPEEICRELLPSEPGLLRVMFPVLGRVQAVAAARTRRALPQQTRRELAREALCELLARVAERWPLIVVIDDVQWIDAESLYVLERALAMGRGRMLWVFASRPARETPPSVAELWARSKTSHVISLDALNDREAQELARTLLAQRGRSDTPESASAIAREASGLPVFIRALIEQSGEPRAIGEVLRARVSALESAAQALLETVCIASGPLPQRVAAASCAIDPVEFPRAVAALKNAKLVRTRRAPEGPEIECFHARIRDRLLANIELPKRGGLHLNVARQWDKEPGADPEVLAHHYLEGGDRERARAKLLLGASRAERLLAFERAATLYQRALSLTPAEDSTFELRGLLANALRYAGKTAEAAESYLEAQAHAVGHAALEYERLALECLLQSAQIDRGLTQAQSLLAKTGVLMAKGPRTALLSLLQHRLRLRIRGLTPAAPRHDQREALACDVTWSLGLSLGFVDMIGSAELLARHLRAALELGDERRIARGLALEAAHVALQERSPSSRAHTLLSRAQALASKQDDPALSGLVALSQSATAFSEQRLRDTRDYAARAHAEFARHPGALLWERSNARYLEGVALAYLGDFAPLRVLSAEHLTQARERGDRYGITNFVLSIGYWIDLIDDAPDAAEDAIRALLRGWSQTGYHYQHFAALLSLATIDLYRGGSAAERRIERDFRGLEASLLLRVRSLAMLMGFLRGRAYVASALEALGPRKREQLQKARGQVKRILSSKVPASAGYATCLRGTIALAEGREEHALALLRSAEAVMNAYDIGMYRDAIRIGIGTLEGGDEGKARSLSARDALSTMGVRNVANYVRMVLPGLPCSEG